MQGRLETEIKKENVLLSKIQNMPDYVQEWYYNLKASQKTITTCRDYINKIEKFLTFINTSIREIDPQNISLNDIQRYFILIQKREVNGKQIYTSDSYQQTVWCCLNNFFEFLYKTNKISQNHMTMISKPKNKDLERINENRILLTKYDFNHILESVEEGVGSDKAKAFQKRLRNRDRAILLLFMTTGMRETALSEINIEDINFDNNILKVVDKGNKYHVYNLSEKTINSLELWLQDREEWNTDSDALFIAENGNRIGSSTLAKLVDKYCQDALGFHISPHKLRAGFCSILYQETGNAEFVRRAVGHSNISTTQRYIVTDNNERAKASELIDGLLN